VSPDLLFHLRRARDLADRHYAEPLDLEALAAAAGVSRFHFLRSFASTYGRTPSAYLAERRIERAQDLLRATNLTVTEVCMAVGYSSLGSFSDKFHRLVGMSPSPTTPPRRSSAAWPAGRWVACASTTAGPRSPSSSTRASTSFSPPLTARTGSRR
jgi:AraC-like DNA-binding protein